MRCSRLRSRVLVALSCAAFACAIAATSALAADRLVASGSCRDGVPHGAYQLRFGDGRLRAAGAFNEGKRTSSFIFWNRAGAREAHVPYDDDVVSGTVAVWYPGATSNANERQKLEAPYAYGRINGVKRSWHPDGRLRAEQTFRDGRLIDAKAWSARGAALAARDARAMAERDVAVDEAYLRSLADEVRDHPPPCASGARAARPASGR